MAQDEVIKSIFFIIIGISILFVLIPGFRKSMGTLTGLSSRTNEEAINVIQTQDILTECKNWMNSFGMKGALSEELVYHATVNLPPEVSWDYCQVEYEDDYEKCRASCIYLIFAERACKADPYYAGDVSYGQGDIDWNILVERCIDSTLRGTDKKLSIKDCTEARMLKRDWNEGCDR